MDTNLHEWIQRMNESILIRTFIQTVGQPLENLNGATDNRIDQVAMKKSCSFVFIRVHSWFK